MSERRDEHWGDFLVKSESHLHGRLIVEKEYPEVFESLKRVLEAVRIPLLKAGPFKENGRPLVPKRQKAGGQFVLKPVDHPELNNRLKQAFEDEDWRAEPLADPKLIDSSAALRLRGDFVRGRIFVEVEFGNIASMYRDLFKFQIASRSRVGEAAILIVGTQCFSRFYDTNVASYEDASKLLPYMAIGLQMPVWILGIEPRDFAPLRKRYDEMRDVCARNGVSCIPFEEVLRKRGRSERG